MNFSRILHTGVLFARIGLCEHFLAPLFSPALIFTRMEAPLKNPTLDTLMTAFQKTHDPRDPRGVRHNYHGVLILVFLGLLARLPYISHIQRWSKRYWRILREPLGFTRKKPPVDTTISRILAKTTIKELQDAFAEFVLIGRWKTVCSW